MTISFVEWLTQLGRLDLAFEIANRSIEKCADDGVRPPSWQILWLPELQPLRRDPRFRVLVARLGFEQYWQTFGPPDDTQVSR